MDIVEILKYAFPLIIFELALKVFCIYKLYHEEPLHMPRIAWLMIILFVSTIGSLAYLYFGRPKD